MDAATWLRLADPIGQGEWIADLDVGDQALILAGWLDGPPADVMVRMRSIAATLRADPWRASLPAVAAAVEHLLHGLRDLDTTTPKE